MPFVQVPFTVTANEIADQAIQRLMARWDGWQPADADMEVIQIETLASMASDAASTAAIVPDAVFRGYDTKLVGVPYISGLPAEGNATFTVLDDAGYTSDDVVELGIEGVGFVTDEPLVIDPGDTTVTVAITCLTDGIAGNELSGSADLITSIPWVVSIDIADPTSGGSDAEGDLPYQDRLSEQLQLQATTLVTGRDFELMAVMQPQIGRAKAIVGVAREVTVAITKDDGTAFTGPSGTAVKDDLATLYEGYRQVNTDYVIIDPTYTAIAVTFKLVAIPDYDPDDITARATDAVTNWLLPVNWGRPQGVAGDTDLVWMLDTVVRYSELLRVLAIDGVRYVDTTVTRLNGGTADVALTGTVPLTTPGVITALPTVPS